ncbi:capsule assembly Wzi family protein [Catalinimonas alkaloidigena]|uniref:capsule assembly Wzi family protein n=1 Tax=Catalinimonas alkaloidigena TaxID=1075417 RepID=UPI00240646F1|nr:capsule assembly Wzi family protein [Catalinimonas alkaloidigena]
MLSFDKNAPHYLVANQYGLVEDTSFNQLIGLGINRAFEKDKPLSFSFNATIFGRYTTKGTDLFIQQGYLGIKYKAISIYAGRREQTLGVHVPSLSTGSLAISQNIRPFPMIQIAIDSFVNLPLTNGFVKIKGTFGHAWLEKDRYIENPYLHFKSFYLKSNVTLPVNFYVGINHFALWGGNHPRGDTIPQNFGDYFRVILGKSSRSQSLRGEYINALGDHLGIVEYGITAHAKDFDLKIYNQMPFEDKTGLKRFFFNRDRLVGVDIDLQKGGIPIRFLYEYLYTLHQSGPGTPDPPEGISRKDLSYNYGHYYGGRDDYYNNALYRSGWTYMDRIIGNPLIMTEEHASKYLDNVNSFFQYIVNNRIKAHHVGVETFSNNLSFRFLGTYSNNYGTYAGLNGGQEGWLSKEAGFEDYEYAFKQPLRQWYLMIESTASLYKNKLKGTVGFAYDTGEIYNASGIMVALKWQYHRHKR